MFLRGVGFVRASNIHVQTTKDGSPSLDVRLESDEYQCLPSLDFTHAECKNQENQTITEQVFGRPLMGGKLLICLGIKHLKSQILEEEAKSRLFVKFCTVG